MQCLKLDTIAVKQNNYPSCFTYDIPSSMTQNEISFFLVSASHYKYIFNLSCTVTFLLVLFLAHLVVVLLPFYFFLFRIGHCICLH